MPFLLTKLYTLFALTLFNKILLAQECRRGFESWNDTCLSCADGFYSLKESSFLNNPFPRTECAKTLKLKKKLDIFVSDKSCPDICLCDGSKQYPLDNLIEALEKINSFSKMFMFTEVRLFLLGKEFFILAKDANIISSYFFRRTNINITIGPFLCSDGEIIGCLKSSENLITINIKNTRFFFFVSFKFKLNNVAIKGYDLHLQSTNCSNLNQICCDPEALISQIDGTCDMRKAVNLKPSEKNSWGLFNLESLENSLIAPELVLENCRVEFINTAFECQAPCFTLMIKSLNGSSSSISILKVSVLYSFFSLGIVSLSSSPISYYVDEIPSSLFIEFKEFYIGNYDYFYFRTNNLSLFSVGKYLGAINFIDFRILELKSNIGINPLIFLFVNFGGRLLISDLLIKDSESHTFLSCFQCGYITINNTLLSDSHFLLIEPYLNLEETAFAYVNQLVFNTFSFLINEKNRNFKCIIFKKIKEKVNIENFIATNAKNINFLIVETLVKLTSFSINFCENKNVLLNISEGSAELINFEILYFTTNRENMIIMSTNPISSKNSIFFLNGSLVNIFFDNIEGYNVLLTWSISSAADSMKLKNLKFFNFSSKNNVKENLIFFESYFFNSMEFEQIEYSNFLRRWFVLLSLYEFVKLSITNCSFVNVDENRYYFIAVECSNCRLIFSNILMENITFFFDTFLFLVSHGLYENISFKNISKIEYRLFAVFWFEAHELCILRNISFVSSSFSEAERFYFWPSDAFYILYFIHNCFVLLEKASFVIPNSNINMRENYILASLKNSNITIKEFYSKNFYCRKDFPRNTAFENGILTFLSSDSYLKGADVDSEVIIQNSTVQACRYCGNGVLGFLNVQIIRIFDILILNSETANGGAISVIFSSQLFLNKLQTFNSKAHSLGGVLLIIGTTEVKISVSTFKNAEAYSGGAIYARNNPNFVVVDSIFIDAFAIKNGGVFFIFNSNVVIKGGAFRSVLTEGDGGGVFMKSGGLAIYKGFISKYSKAESGGFLYVEEGSSVFISNITIEQAFAFVKGICLLINDCYSFSMSNISLLKTGSSFGYGTLYIENLLANKTYDINNIFLFENRALDACFLSFYSSVNLFLENITILNNVGPLLTLTSPYIKDLSTVHLINFIIFYGFDQKLGERWNTLFKFENINAIFKKFIFHGADFDQYSLSASKCSLNLEEIVINANRTHIKDNLPIFFYFEETKANFYDIFFVGSPNMGFLLMTFSEFNSSKMSVFGCRTFKEACFQSFSSTLSLAYSNFIKNRGINIGAFRLMQTIFQIASCNFFENSVENVAESTISSYDVTFSKMVNDIYSANDVQGPTVSFLSNSLFLISEGTSLGFQGTNVDIENCLVQKSQTGFETKFKSKGVWTSNSNLSIQNSIFHRLLSDLGGALRIESTLNKPKLSCVLINNLFTNCVSDYGGVFLIRGDYKINITNNSFRNNSAVKHERNKLGDAGVGVFLCPRCTGQDFYLFNNEFWGNSAEHIFPTIFSFSEITHEKSSVPTNVFINNSDRLNFTTSLSFFPLKIEIKLFDAQGNSLKANAVDKLEIMSGGLLDLELVLRDNLGQTLIFDSLSKGTISEISSARTSTFMISNTRGYSHEGIISINKLMFNANPNNSFAVKTNIEFKNSIFIPFIKLADSESLHETVVEFFSRPCKLGEIYIEGDQTCFECPKNKYSIEDPMKTELIKQKCVPCPPNAICPGGAKITPKAGFWRSSYNSTLIIECLCKDSCLGYGENMDEEQGNTFYHTFILILSLVLVEFLLRKRKLQ